MPMFFIQKDYFVLVIYTVLSLIYPNAYITENVSKRIIDLESNPRKSEVGNHILNFLAILSSIAKLR